MMKQIIQKEHNMVKNPSVVAQCKGLRIPESRGIFACGIRNTAQGIRNPTKD